MRREVRQSGFTLIELMVVIVVISILAGAVVPMFGSSRSDAQLRAAARDLISALRLARSEAVASGRPHRLCLESDTQTYWIESWNEDQEIGPIGFLPQRAYRMKNMDSESPKLESRSSPRPRPNAQRLPKGVTLQGRAAPAFYGDDPEAVAYAQRLEERMSERRASVDSGVEVTQFFPDGTADGYVFRLAYEKPGDGDDALLLRVDAITGQVDLKAESAVDALAGRSNR